MPLIRLGGVRDGTTAQLPAATTGRLWLCSATTRWLWLSTATASHRYQWDGHRLVGVLLVWLALHHRGILGIIFGFLALNQIKQSGQGGRGMAIAGIVIGVIVTAIVILVGILGAVSGSLSDTHSSAPAVVITFEQQPVLATLTT